MCFSSIFAFDTMCFSSKYYTFLIYLSSILLTTFAKKVTRHLTFLQYRTYRFPHKLTIFHPPPEKYKTSDNKNPLLPTESGGQVPVSDILPAAAAYAHFLPPDRWSV